MKNAHFEGLKGLFCRFKASIGGHNQSKMAITFDESSAKHSTHQLGAMGNKIPQDTVREKIMRISPGVFAFVSAENNNITLVRERGITGTPCRCANFVQYKKFEHLFFPIAFFFFLSFFFSFYKFFL